MNIYLDIYGVFKGTESPNADLVELMTFILDHFPGRVYWLTSYCNGVNNSRRVLAGIFDDELLDRIEAEIQVTQWGEYKSNAIDFSEEFLWLDDILRPADKEILLQHNVLNNYIPMNWRDPLMAKKALGEVVNRLK